MTVLAMLQDEEEEDETLSSVEPDTDEEGLEFVDIDEGFEGFKKPASKKEKAESQEEANDESSDE